MQRLHHIHQHQSSSGGYNVVKLLEWCWKSQSGWKQVLGMRTWVWIWNLLPRTVEYSNI